MRKNNRNSLALDIAVVIIFVACAFGWFANLYKAANHILVDPQKVTGVFVVRVIGMFVPPVGIVAGYL
jgi:hypothetical protein